MIVLVSAKQGGGKTTLVNGLLSKLGAVQAIKLRLAQPLYEMHDLCRAVLQKYNVQGYDYTKKDGPLLQRLGTEWGRNEISQGIWVQCLINQVQQLPKDMVVLVEDVRFQNEFDAIATVPDVLRIRLNCDRDIRKQRCESWRENEFHQSEIDLDDYAARNMFDMNFDSGKTEASNILETVLWKIKSIQYERKSHNESDTRSEDFR